MLDIKLIRESPQLVEENVKRRGDAEALRALHELIAKDKERLEALKYVEDMRRRRNELTKRVTAAKKKGADIGELTDKAKSVGNAIKQKEEELKRLEERCAALLLRVPNMLHESVPDGAASGDNLVVRTHGEKPRFDFAPKPHVELLEALGLLDAERAARASGRGFYYLKGRLALLDHALQRFALDALAKKKFTIVEPPFMLSEEAAAGATDMATFAEQMYKVGSGMRLIGTAEHALAAMHMNETLSGGALPLAYAGVSPCFRKEVGAHGKYTRGLFRMHHFNKVEQFVFCLPDDSWKWHEKLQQNAEKLYEALGIHFRTVVLCAGDTSALSAKTYDIEVWMADGEFREAGSNSNCTDYQARRLGVKWRGREGEAPSGYVHTLNNTAIATSRAMIALIEQHQQADGTVAIPKALQRYTKFKTLE